MRRKNSAPPERGVDDQTITVGGLGTKGGTYRTRVRATTHEGVHSDWTDHVQFTLTDSVEGTASDPNLPNNVTNVIIRGMLNAIYVEFDDEFFSTTKPLMSHNMGSYEIEISNVSDQFPSSGNVWTTTLGEDDSAGPPDGPTRKFKVPTGDGFICTGMKSTSAGLTHYVRVRGINADGEASAAWSTPVKSVVLDTDDVSQTAVIVGENSIHATHVKAGTLTATELLAGTITATEISSGQVFASQIQLPAANPGTDGNASELHATRKFTIDLNGNMWWGNYADIAAAISAAQESYITAAGNATFIGEISTDTGGNARVVLGDNTTTVGDDDEDTAPAEGGYGYILGYTAHGSEAIPGHVVFTDESNIAAAYLVAPRFHSGFNYSGVRLRDNNTTSTEALLVGSTGAWGGVVKGTDVANTAHADSSFVINTADGAYIYNSANAPSSTTNRLYSLSGDLYWNGTEVGGGSSGVLDIPGLPALDVSESVTSSDLIAIYDTDETEHNKLPISEIIALVPDDGIQSIVCNEGIEGSGLSGPTAVIYLQLNEIGDTAPATNDYLTFTNTDFFGANGRATVEEVVSAGVTVLTNPVLAPDGGSALPAYSFASDTNLGFWRSAENEVSFSAGNSHRLTLNQNGMTNWGGTAALPSYSFLSDTNTGMYRPAADEIGLSTGGYARVSIKSDGKVGIGYTAPNYTLAVNGNIWANSWSYLAAGAQVYPRLNPWENYDGTYPADLGSTSFYWQNVYLQSHVWASDVNNKSNIADAIRGLSFVNQLRPVTYTMDGATGRNGARTHHGFIAQEIETLLDDAADNTALWTNGLAEAQPEREGPNGEVIPATEEKWRQGLRYEQFIPILTKAVQELSTELDAAKARIAVLEG